MSELQVERRSQRDTTGVVGNVMITPLISDDYWSYRVVLRPNQAINAFPKFSTTGIGFAVEDDWNTNLPWTCDATEIAEHIGDNRADETITDSEIVQAIVLIQEAIRADQTKDAA